jgi:hypothetical protein
VAIWRFDQGRLDYFLFDEIKQIALALNAINGTITPFGVITKEYLIVCYLQRKLKAKLSALICAGNLPTPSMNFILQIP